MQCVFASKKPINLNRPPPRARETSFSGGFFLTVKYSMARQQQPRLMTASLNDLDSIEVIDAAEQWAVTYRGQLISVQRKRIFKQPKYLRSILPTEASALNLAAKLNNLFDTEEYQVRRIQ